jgi:hypothetical protein
MPFWRSLCLHFGFNAETIILKQRQNGVSVDRTLFGAVPGPGRNTYGGGYQWINSVTDKELWCCEDGMRQCPKRHWAWKTT